MVNGRIRESDLIEPVLKIIAKYGDNNEGLDITKIDELLRKILPISDEDKKILKGRKDDRFSQIVRNLVSHRTLERHGLAHYQKTSTYRRGAYYLTRKGASMVSEKNKTRTA
ncbi:hypothetical protein [Stappia sp.]|uniref:hypothetical protein n=1 Tax=Stappia sp. TaxID=1870903 RepID=UPI0032D975E4